MLPYVYGCVHVDTYMQYMVCISMFEHTHTHTHIQYYDQEELSGGDKYKCDHCKQLQDSVKKLSLIQVNMCVCACI